MKKFLSTVRIYYHYYYYFCEQIFRKTFKRHNYHLRHFNLSRSRCLRSVRMKPKIIIVSFILGSDPRKVRRTGSRMPILGVYLFDSIAEAS
jgi:hypothetical protein